MAFFHLLFTLLVWIGVVGAAAVPGNIVPGQEVTPLDLVGQELPRRAAPCVNSPTNRACWLPGFDINTDFEAVTPHTGVTREYTLVATEIDNFLGPDGVVKEKEMVFNNMFPGPTIFANWGDRLNITVVNRLRTNGTSIHWHGLKQNGSALYDGVPGISACAIAPGTQLTYSMIVQQYGTTWYHSHFTAQYGNGIIGQMQFNGPASANYDLDLGTFPITDYYYTPADQIVEFTMNNGVPLSDNVLLNGTNINPKNPSQGAYANITLTPGKSHRIRFINPSAQHYFSVSMVGHNMTVIEVDFIPVEPLVTDSFFYSLAQRVDVIVHADQPVDNYWINVTFSKTGLCGGSHNPFPAAILHYAGAPKTLPTVQGTVPASAETGCLDSLDFVPVLKRTAPVEQFLPTIQSNVNNTIAIQLDTTGNPSVRWKINGTQVLTDWGKPAAQSILNDTSFVETDNIRSFTGTNAQWAWWLIENQGGPNDTAAATLPHPIHIHGQDFLILAKSTPQTPVFNSTLISSLKGNNPTRRDTTVIPTQGWMAVAFTMGNPGPWFAHCHIAWHVSGGLGWTFIEDPAQLRRTTSAFDKMVLDRTCRQWNAYFPAHDPFPQDDSGLKVRHLEEAGLKLTRLK